MDTDRLEIFWKDHLVDFIDDPTVDMFHLYGKWTQASGPFATEFMAEFQAHVQENMAGLDVTVGKANPISGEFTDLGDGTADILMSLPRGK